MAPGRYGAQEMDTEFGLENRKEKGFLEDAVVGKGKGEVRVHASAALPLVRIE